MVIPMSGDTGPRKPKSGDIPYRELYPIAEAAVLLGISDTTVYRMADSGEIPTRRIGSRRLVPRKELMELIEGLPPAETQRRPKKSPAPAAA